MASVTLLAVYSGIGPKVLEEYSVMPNSPTNYPTPVYPGATGRKREKERARARAREGENVCEGGTVCVSTCAVCVCVCVCEREIEYSFMPNSPTNYPTPVYPGATGRESKGERERERERERESLCGGLSVSVHV